MVDDGAEVDALKEPSLLLLVFLVTDSVDALDVVGSVELFINTLKESLDEARLGLLVRSKWSCELLGDFR